MDNNHKLIINEFRRDMWNLLDQQVITVRSIHRMIKEYGMNNKKVCKICGYELDLENFRGMSRNCTECKRKKQKAYYQASKLKKQAEADQAMIDQIHDAIQPQIQPLDVPAEEVYVIEPYD